MNYYFTCQKLSKFSKTCFTTTKEIELTFSIKSSHETDGPTDRRTDGRRGAVHNAAFYTVFQKKFTPRTFMISV